MLIVIIVSMVGCSKDEISTEAKYSVNVIERDPLFREMALANEGLALVVRTIFTPTCY